jgi:4-hydroxy-tetrahydrodipicolinate synthase
VATLAETCKNVVAIKEAGGNAERVSQIAAATSESFEILSGDDSLTLPFMSIGACGVISVASNLIPGAMTELVAAANAGDWTKALMVHEQYYPLFNAFLKLDTNPVPIKAALAIRGLIGNELRLPLIPLDGQKMDHLRGLLTSLNLL